MLSMQNLVRLTILMGVITITLALWLGKYKDEAKNVQLGRQVNREELPAFKRDQDFSPKKYDFLVQLVTRDKHKGFCSAFVVSDDYAITAAHCLVNEEQKIDYDKEFMVRTIKVVDKDTAEEQMLMTPGEVVGVAIRQDYAIIKGDFRTISKAQVDLTPIVTRNIFNREVLPGVVIPLFAIGFANGIYDAVALSQSACGPVYDFIMCSGLMYHGMSGGALVDPANGIVYGVNHAIGPNGDTYFKVLIGIFEAFEIEVN
jgi:hypothetical protein